MPSSACAHARCRQRASTGPARRCVTHKTWTCFGRITSTTPRLPLSSAAASVAVATPAHAQGNTSNPPTRVGSMTATLLPSWPRCTETRTPLPVGASAGYVRPAWHCAASEAMAVKLGEPLNSHSPRWLASTLTAAQPGGARRAPPPLAHCCSTRCASAVSVTTWPPWAASQKRAARLTAGPCTSALSTGSRPFSHSTDMQQAFCAKTCSRHVVQACAPAT